MVLIVMTEYITVSAKARHGEHQRNSALDHLPQCLIKQEPLVGGLKERAVDLSPHLLLNIISLKWLCAVRSRIPLECALHLALFSW